MNSIQPESRYEHGAVSAKDDAAVLVEAGRTSSSYDLQMQSSSLAESAGALLLFSLLVFIEGGIRLNEVDVKDLTPEPRPGFPPIPLFIAAIAELVFGLVGVVLGCSAFLSYSRNKQLLKASIFLQVALSIFVFTVFNLAEPIYRIKHVIPYVPRPQPIENVSLFRGAESMALLTGVQFAFALFLGQMIFMMRLARSSGDGEPWSLNMLRLHSFGWTGNLAFAGLWTLALGSGILSHKENFPSSPERAGTVFFFHPHAGTEPGFTIATGVILFCWGVCGVVLTLKRFKKVNWYLCGSVVAGFVVYLNFTLVQLGQFRIGRSGGGLVATNTLHLFAMFFLSCYFLYRAKVAEKQRE